MASLDNGLEFKEVLRRTIKGKTELVCYQVTSGRGRSLVEHARVNDKKFAKKIFRAVKSYDRILAALAHFDATVSDGVEAKSAARQHFIDDVRTILDKVGKF